jgi:hypothetical protein
VLNTVKASIIKMNVGLKKGINMLNTFEIQQEYRALEDLLNEVDQETGEFVNSKEDIKEYIESLKADRDTKLINIERLRREKKGQADTIDAEIKRLQSLKKQVTNNINSLIDLQFVLTGGDKLDLGIFKFSKRKSKSVVIINDNDIPDKYCDFKKVPNKTKIKEAIQLANKNGESFFGAIIEEKVSLVVR